jgi:hypothetical protein
MPATAARPGVQVATQRRAATAGLALSGLSVALTFTVAVLGPSLVEPALPGAPGQPPWSFSAHPSPYLVVTLSIAAIAAGTAGLGVAMRGQAGLGALTASAARRGHPGRGGAGVGAAVRVV